MGKQVITADDIRKAAAGGSRTLDVKQKDCIVTPGAWDKIEELGIGFAEDACSSPSCSIPPEPAPDTSAGNRSISETSDLQSITDRVCTLLKEKLPGTNSVELSAIVRKVVESKLSSAPAPSGNSKNPAVKVVGDVSLIDGDLLLDKESGPAVPGKVQISDAIRFHEDTHLTATYMKWEKSLFSRTVDAPEISIVVEGEVEIKADGRSMKAKAGDILYMAQGAKVEYNTPSMVKLACVSS
ncbi:cupin domain-containing protein [Desulfospira joergensenii]|uniref:cupin domain-containing protein n=1 Tax=Desulfospira joergensenii TaxID=53329 RepID=UPI0003B46AF9|nr:cupin domain-containing protein [Desulfospira joergensenii]